MDKAQLGVDHGGKVAAALATTSAKAAAASMEILTAKASSADGRASKDVWGDSQSGSWSPKGNSKGVTLRGVTASRAPLEATLVRAVQMHTRSAGNML